MNKPPGRSDKRKLYVILLLVAVVVLAGVFIYIMNARGGTALGKTYCNSTGKVCFSYPKNWRLRVYAQAQATVTDPATGTSVQYAPQTYSQADPCGAGSCLFKTLSVVISNGFSNANDVAGVFQSKGAGIVAPEYFLMATKQLDEAGLSVGTMTDLKQTDPHAIFVNGNLTQFEQSLAVAPPTSTSFSSLTAAQNWLSSPAAETAEAVVNSARPSH